ncbi:branched-chain amino acid ABC transporter permease [Thermaerobacter subterraneus]|uniref:Amino acid/amide ABC transporter membrane protein 1, HAAT family n=1 Tax=Thermaerobacter subterraneus DSM 13965 TaxID=867903 RepID=K6PQU8_9FIRM|nr:branched-chain amino acid ABC transporter permease [Thermaerobacter subterraneus]EKP95317.1 amino acid/amide ABC transporter membrane protein 1, HAAT family [Thermaerobacter subterraneus DSM 13965]
MVTFLQQLANALQLGGIYALIALGYTMVYGVLKLINFAHGDIFMVACFIGLFVAVYLKLPLAAVLVLTMAATALLGVTVERVAYRPLRNAPRMSLVITALGVGLFLENLVRATVGAAPRNFPALVPATTWNVGGITVSGVQVLIVAVSVLLMALLRYVVMRTMLGKAMRAIADNREVLGLMGINPDRIITATFAIGSALAAAGGILVAQAYPVIEPYMGILIGWKAFIAAVLGGIGLIDGAMLGGFLLGLTEVLVAAYLPSTFRDGIAFTILILVLLVRPTGLLGRPLSTKV